MNKNQTQDPSKANRMDKKKDKLKNKLKAKLKKKLHEAKESGSPVQKNIQQETERPTLTSTKGPYPKPKPKLKVFKFNNDELSTSNNKNDKKGESNHSKSQLKKQKAKLAKKQKKPADLVANKMTKNNKSKVVTAKETKKQSSNDEPKGKKKMTNKSNQKLNPIKPSKRQFDENKASSATKRMKTVNGFVEIDTNDQEGIQLVEKWMKKKKSNLEQIKKKQEDVGPAVIVHKISENVLNSETNSDSEDDSYIEKFFNKSDEEFDENRVYSQDEIESKKVNGFLSKDSEDGASSDDDASSNHGEIVNGQKQNELSKYEHQSDDDSVDSAMKFNYYGSESDNSNNHALFYNDDSDISCGSEVQSDENEMNYGSSFESGSDEEGAFSQDYSDDDYNDMEEDSDDDYSYSEGSDYSNENYQSDESSDTYKNFMDGNSQDSNDDHEYTGAKMFSVIYYIPIIG